jgi:3-methyladenine DNA glycosylase AlkD
MKRKQDEIKTEADLIIRELKSLSNPVNVAGMARFGISSNKTFGVSIPEVRRIAKKAGKNHSLALALWKSGYHEARIMASLIDEPENVTPEQMDRWTNDFDSWDVCDQCCSNLFDKTPYAYDKIKKWSCSKKEFVKRAAFALLAVMAVHDKKAGDDVFVKFFPLIKRESTDGRNFVRKAVNWALRSIGKRTESLRKKVIKLSKEIYKADSKTAKWIASDAIKELESSKIIDKVKKL